MVVKCYLAAYKWNLLKLESTLAMRKVVQRNRIVSDVEIISRMYFTYSKLETFKRLGVPKFH